MLGAACCWGKEGGDAKVGILELGELITLVKPLCMLSICFLSKLSSVRAVSSSLTSSVEQEQGEVVADVGTEVCVEADG